MFLNRSNYLFIFAAVLFVLSFALLFGQFGSTAIAAPSAAETETPIPTQPPPTATNTATPIPPNTATPTATATTQPTEEAPETITPEPTPQPPSEIPEPITVILFGTGLAALSAAAAKRKKAE